MVKKLLLKSSQIFTQKQKTIFSAALIIMLMIAASRVLGLVRNRALAQFFSVNDLSVYFASFRIPETIFEILVFGTFSSAFIPIFTSYISQKKKEEAWYVASVCLNFAFLVFLFFGILIFIFANPLYHLIAPGFSDSQVIQIANLSRVLLVAQAFFVLSYFLTSVLESMQRFLVPALAPLFYNLGIILGTIFLSSRFGLYGPVFGAVFGALCHFLLQLPLAFLLGFRPKFKIDLQHPGVREIGRLALPRIVELSSLQLGKMAELFLASLVSAGAYTYFTFANSLALLPIGLFGTSIGKAALPTLSYQVAQKQFHEFQETLISLLNQIVFFVLPSAVFLTVLRIPVVRLVFGADRFGWDSTVQTGLTLSAFSLGIVAQALLYPLTRAFWALHDTKTPVKISIGMITMEIIFGGLLIVVFKLPIWTLALAFSLASLTQVVFLFFFLKRRVLELKIRLFLITLLKIIIASSASGGLMFFLLKVLDRSAWDKKLSFLRFLGLKLPVSFQHFVLDTRYTFNLLLLTIFVALIGFLVYLFFCWILRVDEINFFKKLIAKIKKPNLVENIVPPPVE
ncbi:MAG: murein biosynthesis integral membrane protein MurJ [Candidatus Shapirobacteria bacterium]|nr:murein biosynthesis integral membrane protein MurJ [Candidatus Shapirobacteria bacterium]